MRKSLAVLAALWISNPLSAQQTEPEERANHYVDHLLLAINDLERGVEEVKRLTGVRPRFDGRDAQLGTRSSVIGLGGEAYLEIIAPDPKADPAAIDPELKPLILDRVAKFDSLTPFLWVIGTGNLERTLLFARRAGSRPSEIYQGMRKRSWGRRLDWTWARVWRPDSRVTPVFMQWGAETKPPQSRAPEGCELTGLKINSRNFKSLHTLIATTQVEAEVEGSEEDSLRFTLQCRGEEVVFEPVSLTGVWEPPGSERRQPE